ncbi:MAG TPA: HlyD family secretion protein [Bryobacteraceae bacterium]|nr:HlyD family secretion protein [Bryobacteraceae bacterium]
MTRQVETDIIEVPEELTSEEERAHERKSSAPRKRVLSRMALFAVPILISAGVALWWLNSQKYESTDDAQVEGHLDSVSARISGTVIYINPQVENNHFVKAGTLLLELDPRDYEAALQRAQANLDATEAEARSAQVTVPIVNASAFGQLHSTEAARQQAAAAVDVEQANLIAAQHKLQRDEAIHARAERDRVRYEALVEKREISRSDYDARATDAAATAQAVEADRAALISIEQEIAEARSLVAQRDAQIEAARTAPQQVSDARARLQSAAGHLEQARADLHTAQLNLSYTKIYAPVSGIIGRKTVELGHRVQPGQGLLMIVPLDDIWITANFKETQLKRMRPGQAVSIHVDTFDHDFNGKIEELPGAAGTFFSLFPPENASGNYVKVVQRFPVRIRFDAGQDPQHLLRPGMSVEPRVRVH